MSAKLIWENTRRATVGVLQIYFIESGGNAKKHVKHFILYRMKTYLRRGGNYGDKRAKQLQNL